MADLSNAQFMALFVAKLKQLIDGDLTVSECAASVTEDANNWYTLTTTAAQRLVDQTAESERILAMLYGLVVASGAPQASDGEDGAYYFDAANGGFYGPKTEGAWGSKLFDMTGPPGAAATIEVGAITELAPGATPTVNNTGTPAAAVLAFGLPGTPSDVDTSSEVDAKIADALAGLIDSAPGALDTLNELAAALGDDANFAATVTASLATKLDASVYTAADVLAKLLGVDGGGSGLDADLLDGEHGAYYLDPASHDGARAVQTAPFTATHGRRWPCDTSAGGFTVTLSDAVPVGKSVRLYDPAKSWLSNWLRILPASGTGEIVGVTPGEPLIGDMAGVEITLTREASGWSWTSTQPALNLEIY